MVMLSLVLPVHNKAQGGVQVAQERNAIPGYSEPNTPPNKPLPATVQAALNNGQLNLDPAAFVNGQLNLNQALYVRWYDSNRTPPPQGIVVFLPGVIAGANSFSIIAPRIVQLTGGNFEVWTMDRRSNLLEDPSKMIEAEVAGTRPAAVNALNYYSDPTSPGAYLGNHPFEISPMLAEWGLDVHLRDAKAVVDQARSVVGASGKVFLGGISLGAIMAEMFAAYNFNGTAGYTLVNGLILLDATAAPGAPGVGPISDNDYLNGTQNGPLGASPGVNRLRNPQAPGDEPFPVTVLQEPGRMVPFNPLTFQLAEVAAQLALFDPNGTSPLPSPFTFVPATNEAAFGYNLDDEFQQTAFVRISMGFLAGAPDAVAIRMNDPNSPANPNGLWQPKNLAPTLQTWAKLSDLTSIGLKGAEPSDLPTVARSLFYGAGGSGSAAKAAGTSNFLEWYFPTRLLADMNKVFDLGKTPLSPTALAAQMQNGGNAITMTQNKSVNIPILPFRAQYGIIPNALAFTFYKNSTSITAANFKPIIQLTDYAHGDVILAANDQVAKPVADFVTGKL
jgi:pimeloyl-ACP methyl ester carboxylesterase